MPFDNFTWNNKEECVSWIFEGRLLIRKFKNLQFASLNIENNYVYIEAGQNYKQDEIYYILENGNILFVCNKKENIISWRNDYSEINVLCDNIIATKYYINQYTILVIVLINISNTMLLGYQIDGTLLFRVSPPENYKLLYFSTFENNPAVIGERIKGFEDDYERSRCHFIINLKSGDLTKGTIAY
jgi:hypothetical protein